MTRILKHRQLIASVAALAALLWWSGTAFAQIDPLLFLRRVPPTVILAVDTSFRMMEDGSNRYYDPKTYVANDDFLVANALGVAVGEKYRRLLHGLEYTDISVSTDRFEVGEITAVRNSNAAYATFFDNTRIEIAKRGIDTALSGYAGSTHRFGLVKLRQNAPKWR